MSFDGLVLTKHGKEEILKAADGGKIIFSHIAFGDGVTNEPYNLKESLSHEVSKLAVTEVERKEDKIILSLDYTNKTFEKGFYFREIGVIANDKLCYYDNCGSNAEYIDPDNEVVTKEKRLRVALVLAETVNVQTNVESELYALKKDVDERFDKQLGNHVVEKDVPSDAVFTDTTYDNASKDASGLMSAEDYANLENITNASITHLIGSVINLNNYTGKDIKGFAVNATNVPSGQLPHGFFQVLYFNGKNFAPNGSGAEPISVQFYKPYSSQNVYSRFYNHSTKVMSEWNLIASPDFMLKSKSVNNFVTTEDGYFLDARMGPTIAGRINSAKTKVKRYVQSAGKLAANGDLRLDSMTISKIATAVGVDYSRIVAYYPVTARPTTTWSCVPHLFYDTSSSLYGVHNLGSQSDSVEVEWYVIYI